jgi:ribulose-phosphate 3-epimerase
MAKMISTSMMCASFASLEKQIRELERLGVEYLHCDVMDGVFVPNFALGTDFIRALRDITDIPLDIHFMVGHPESTIEMFGARQGDILCVHYETATHIERTIGAIKSMGAKAGVALNPATSLSALDYIIDEIDMLLLMTVNPGYAGQKLVPFSIKKIADAKRMIQSCGLNIPIEVDGNVSFENAAKMSAAGADIFVAGTSSVFSKGDSIENNINRLREAINQ